MAALDRPTVKPRPIYLNLLAILMIATALVLIRTRQEATAREIDSAS